jgi:hypothetical protein
MTSFVQIVSVWLPLLAALAATMGIVVIVGFVIYAEFFDAARTSRSSDYLTPEEMDHAR